LRQNAERWNTCHLNALSYVLRVCDLVELGYVWRDDRIATTKNGLSKLVQAEPTTRAPTLPRNIQLVMSLNLLLAREAIKNSTRFTINNLYDSKCPNKVIQVKKKAVAKIDYFNRERPEQNIQILSS
jgi:hypothetical protein